MPLSRADLPNLVDGIRTLYRVIEHADADRSWMAAAGEETGFPLDAPPDSLERSAVIGAAVRLVLQRMMPGGVPSRQDCNDITESDLDLRQRARLLELREALQAQFFANDCVTNPATAQRFRAFLEEVIHELAPGGAADPPTRGMAGAADDPPAGPCMQTTSTRPRQSLLTQLGKYPALLGLPDPQTPLGLAAWGRALQNWLRRKEQLLSHTETGGQVLSGPFVDTDIAAAWHHLRRIAGGRAVPPEPATPMSIAAVVVALDQLVNWAAAAAAPASPASGTAGAGTDITGAPTGGAAQPGSAGASVAPATDPSQPVRPQVQALSEPSSFLDLAPTRQAQRTANRDRQERRRRLGAARDHLRHGGGGRTWNTIDGRPEMAADLAEWVCRSVEMAADYGVGGHWDAAILATVELEVSDLARQATRELVAAAGEGDAEKVQRIAEQIQAEGGTPTICSVFADACAYVATQFRDRWVPPADEDPQAASELASVLREIDKWEGRLELLFRPGADELREELRDRTPAEQAQQLRQWLKSLREDCTTAWRSLKGFSNENQRITDRSQFLDAVREGVNTIRSDPFAAERAPAPPEGTESGGTLETVKAARDMIGAVQRWADEIEVRLAALEAATGTALRAAGTAGVTPSQSATAPALPGNVDSKPPEGGWTTADGPSRWAKLFGVSVDTFKRRCREGRIRHHKLSSKSYQVAITDLPAKHQAKFRAAGLPSDK